MLASLVDRLIRGQGWLDPVGEFIQKVIGGIYKPLGGFGDMLKTLLHGSWLGHSLHPVATDIPLGAWTVAIVADLVAMRGGLSQQVGDFALFVGVLGAYGSVVTGYTDHHETFGHERRIATAHGLINTVVTVLYTASWLMRWQGGAGSHASAVWISAVGYVLVLGGAYLGGDVVFGRGTMVNRNAFIDGPVKEYVAVGIPDDFVEGQMRKVDAEGMAVLMVRYQGTLWAISDVCSHAGGPLDEGKLNGNVVTCPWHGSRFRVDNGGIRRGPATFNQPVLNVREADGRVEVKLPYPLHD
jgi:nitrite reductase/ring-hydroxylating ferredoxin subunit/uncharacterized membrane protein